MKKKRSEDVNEMASRIVGQTTGEIPKETEELIKEKNPHAVALGRAGGLKGGKARAEKLTEERRKEIAKDAARARWGKKG